MSPHNQQQFTSQNLFWRLFLIDIINIPYVTKTKHVQIKYKRAFLKSILPASLVKNKKLKTEANLDALQILNFMVIALKLEL